MLQLEHYNVGTGFFEEIEIGGEKAEIVDVKKDKKGETIVVWRIGERVGKGTWKQLMAGTPMPQKVTAF